MKEIDLQNFLFIKNPTRLELINYKPISSRFFKISVYRNHSFEMVEHTISAYLDYAGIKVNFTYSDYDDSLSFVNLDTTSDLLIIWLDFTRYKNADIENFIKQRIEYLKTIYNKPILFVPFEGNITISDNQVFTYNLNNIKEMLQNKYTEERLEKFSGTKMSPEASLRCSKDLGLNYLPALLKPNLKGIIVDLDNTLYEGVLGEDGTDKLILTEGHILLQKKLKDLSKQGFFLAIASKNDKKDVLDLFEKRKDFPLKKEDFAIICASWKSKAESISEILKFLNVNQDSLLFLDDNIGELFAVKQQYPYMPLVLAYAEGEKTYNLISNYPGFLKLHIQKEDSLRKQDTEANKTRIALLNKLTREDYLKDLKVCLTFNINNLNNITRISELANKTNQFIFNYKRYSPAEVETLIKDRNTAVVSVSLSDKLSDSGIIGVVVVKKQQEKAILEECFVSCRALGRGIDDIIVLGAIDIALKHLQSKKIKILSKKGERNTPALNFIDMYLKKANIDYIDFFYTIKENGLNMRIIKG